jgi:hypothetical protein
LVFVLPRKQFGGQLLRLDERVGHERNEVHKDFKLCPEMLRFQNTALRSRQ